MDPYFAAYVYYSFYPGVQTIDLSYVCYPAFSGQQTSWAAIDYLPHDRLECLIWARCSCLSGGFGEQPSLQLSPCPGRWRWSWPCWLPGDWYILSCVGYQSKFVWLLERSCCCPSQSFDDSETRSWVDSLSEATLPSCCQISFSE